MLRRNVVETLFEKFSHLYYETTDASQQRNSGYAIFNTELYEGFFWGEDYVFSRRLREADFDIWVDAGIEFDHNGVKGAFIQEIQPQGDSPAQGSPLQDSR